MCIKIVHACLLVLLLHAGAAKGERSLRLLSESFLPSLQGADKEFDINGPRTPTPDRTGPALTISGGFDGSSAILTLGPFGKPSDPEPSVSKDIVGLFDKPKFVKAEEHEDKPQECLGYLKDKKKVYCIIAVEEVPEMKG